MQLYLRYTASVFVLVLIHFTLFAQSFSTYRGSDPSSNPAKTVKKGSLAGTWEAGAMLGPDFYYGDLNTKKFLPNRSISAAGGVFVMRQFTNVIGLKGQLLFGGLHGSKDGQEGSQSVNWTFRGTFLDFTVNSVFNLSNLVSPYHDGRKIFAYGTVGIGVNAWNTRLTKGVNGELTNPLQNNGFQAGFVLPFGVGLQYAITSKINAGIEYTVRTIFSDHVDQTVGGYKCDVINLLAFTASYRLGAPKKKLNVQEYGYSSPVTYLPATLVPVPVPQPEAVHTSPGIPSSSDVYEYVVQICAFSQHNYTVAWVKKHYRVDMPVIKESENGLNRYIIGHYYKDLNVAKELCDRLRKKGIHDAWVIAYQNGVRHHVVLY
ncbi:MAG: outer membrane beta-barrel protein [Bacteroidetes bacterium]|nr:outer membrane beta-barrel protein [Bacteroidota bacterium]